MLAVLRLFRCLCQTLHCISLFRLFSFQMLTLTYVASEKQALFKIHVTHITASLCFSIFVFFMIMSLVKTRIFACNFLIEKFSFSTLHAQAFIFKTFYLNYKELTFVVKEYALEKWFAI